MDERDKQPQDIQSIAKRSVKRKQKERKLRKQRKKAKRIKSFFRFILFILLVFCMYEFFKLPQWYLKADSFKKPAGNVIEIINNEIVPDKVIYDELKDVKIPNVPIFLMSVNPIKKEIFKIPVIKKVYIRRYGFPARIQIIVRERMPVVVLKTGLKSKPLAFTTSDGVFVTNRKYMTLIETKPTLKIVVKNPNIDKDWNIKRVEHIRKIVKAVEDYSSEKVRYVDMRNPNDVYVRIESTNVRLGVLDSTVFDRIKRIYAILPQIDNLDGKVKYIDLSWDKVNYLKLESEQKKENQGQ